MLTSSTSHEMSREALIEDIKQYTLANSVSRLTAVRAIGCQLRRPMSVVRDLDSMTLDEARQIAPLVRKWYPDRKKTAVERMLKKHSPQ